MLVGKCSCFHSHVTDAEKQDTRHLTVLPDSTSESLSIDDLQTYLEDRLAELDVKHPEPAAEVEEQDFCRRNE